MNKTCLILHSLLILLTFSLPKNVSAQTNNEYKVKSIILVPANFDNEETAKKIPGYKTTIARAIKDVQDWYASKLPGGKTYKFNEKDIEVVKSKMQLSDKAPSTMGDLKELGGISLLPISLNNVYVVWIIGSNDKSQTGDAFYINEQTNDWRYFINPKMDPEYAKHQNTATKFIGLAAMNEYSLKILNQQNIVGSWNVSLSRLSHELAHAFGLARDGYALGHPCTEISKSECIPGAPQPLPNASEWYNSILGYGSFGFYPNVSFNNTLVNPEIYSLFKSPFINPERTELPTPTTSMDGSALSSISIESIEPQRVKVGDTVTIRGSGFGNVQAESFILLKKATIVKSVDDVINWSDKEIKFVVPDGAETGQFISITKSFTEWDGKKFENVVKKIISTKPIEVIEPPENYININISYVLTCGENNHPLELETYPADPIIELEGHLIERGENLKQGRVLLRVVPSANTGILSYSVLKRREPDNFSVRLRNIGELTPSYSGHYPISLDDLNNPDYQLNLHYQTCPGKELTRITLIEKGSEIGQDPENVDDVVFLFENGQFLEEQDLSSLRSGDNLFLLKKCFKDGSCEIVENSLMIFRVGSQEQDEEDLIERPIKISYPSTDFPIDDTHNERIVDNIEEKTCPLEYNQCGKTYGLEEDEFEPSQTVRIIPICDQDNNIVEYQKRLLLEGEEGWDACLKTEDL